MTEEDRQEWIKEHFAWCLHDETVRNVTASRIQCDEIWSFNYCKQRTVPTATPRPSTLATCGRGPRWTPTRS